MTPELYEKFEQEEARHWWFEGRRRVLRTVLARHLLPRAHRRLLDVGCGTGGMFPLLEEFGEVTGAEYSPDARERAARRFPGRAVLPCALPDQLPAGTWDVVTSFDVLEHVEDAVGSLETMRARLPHDGQVVVTVPAHQFLWSHHDDVNHHFRRYSRKQLVSQLSAAGLRVTWVSAYNSWLFPAVVAARLAEKALPACCAPGPRRPTSTRRPGPSNAVLTRLFASERHALARGSLPLGVSLVAVAQRA